MFSCQTLISFVVWFCFPTVSYAIALGIVYYEGISTDAISTVCTMVQHINMVAMHFFYPGLLSNLIAKSSLDYDAHEYSNLWVVVFITVNQIGAVLMLVIGHSFLENFVLVAIFFSIPVLTILILMVSVVLTISLACTAFIKEADELINVRDIETLVSGARKLTLKMRLLKQGLGPLIFFNIIS